MRPVSCARCGRPVVKSTPVMIRAVTADSGGLLLGEALPYGPRCAQKLLGPKPRRLARLRPGETETPPEQLTLFDDEGIEG